MAKKGKISPEVLIHEALVKSERRTLAAAESCTGGLLSAMITDVSGSSEYFLGGVVAYGNDVKRSILGVKASTLKRYGAVSGPTAMEMAAGVRKALKADIGVSITGIAGPTGGSAKKPVGTVYMAVSAGDGKKRGLGKTLVRKFLFKGNRVSIKRQSAAAALNMLADVITGGVKALKI